jgi:hypothetical protein
LRWRKRKKSKSIGRSLDHEGVDLISKMLRA